MKNATFLVLTIAVLVFAAAAFGSSRQAAATQAQPKWVTKEAGLLRRMFVGDPKPVSITYHRGPKALSLTLRFSRTVYCEMCSGPWGAQSPRGRSVAVTLDPRTHGVISFYLSRR